MHLHEVRDTDSHFLVDENTRDIKYEGKRIPTIVQYDHNSERFTFELPRYIESHDMSLCNDVRVQYINIDSATRDTSKGPYQVADLAVADDDDSMVVCSWLISCNATKYQGKLHFMLRFMCKDEEGNITYAWNTNTFDNLSVSSGMDNGETIVTEYPDILEQWRQEVVDENTKAIEKSNEVIAANTEALNENSLTLEQMGVVVDRLYNLMSAEEVYF